VLPGHSTWWTSAGAVAAPAADISHHEFVLNFLARHTNCGAGKLSTHSKRFNMEKLLIRYREERTRRRVMKTRLIEWAKPMLSDDGVVLSVLEERAKRIHAEELALAAISAQLTEQVQEAVPQAVPRVVGEL